MRGPPPMPITAYGYTVNSFDKAKRLSGLQELPKYLPNNLYLESIIYRNITIYDKPSGL